MSRVRFASPTGEATLLAAEHTYAGRLVADLAAGLVRAPLPRPEDDGIVQLMAGGALADRIALGLDSAAAARDSLRYGFLVGRERLFVWQGEELEASAVALNTALRVGGDAVKLLARVHGQSEQNAYVEGPNRAWLAGVVEGGVRSGILRPGMGWDDPTGNGAGVASFLRERDDEPVVMCTGGGVPGTAGDWARAMTELRRRPAAEHLELAPENWDTVRIRHGLTVLDLQADDWRMRVEQALAPALAAIPG
jgi:hypothetical protein